MLAAVKRLIAGKDDVAGLQQQIEALRREGADASAEIDRLKQLRASAASYDEARDLDDRIARQIWITDHCAAALPGLEVQLVAARAAEQAAALAKHRGILIGLYPRLKAAILGAVAVQRQVIAAREAGCREIGKPQSAEPGLCGISDGRPWWRYGRPKTIGFLASSAASHGRRQYRRQCVPHCRQRS